MISKCSNWTFYFPLSLDCFFRARGQSLMLSHIHITACSTACTCLRWRSCWRFHCSSSPATWTRFAVAGNVGRARGMPGRTSHAHRSQPLVTTMGITAITHSTLYCTSCELPRDKSVSQEWTHTWPLLTEMTTQNFKLGDCPGSQKRMFWPVSKKTVKLQKGPWVRTALTLRSFTQPVDQRHPDLIRSSSVHFSTISWRVE